MDGPTDLRKKDGKEWWMGIWTDGKKKERMEENKE